MEFKFHGKAPITFSGFKNDRVNIDSGYTPVT